MGSLPYHCSWEGPALEKILNKELSTFSHKMIMAVSGGLNPSPSVSETLSGLMSAS